MNADPLAGLSDWHLPDPVGWWPLAPGWWALLLLVVAALATLLFWLRRRRGRRAAPRAALARLAELREDLTRDGDTRRFVAEVSRLLRRMALARFPRERVAGLSGRDWLRFLDATGGEGAFGEGPGRALVEVSFSGRVSEGADPDALVRAAERWVRFNSERTS
ncbi:DUF4381 domain-containing protein [Imhoffiella purpurea]|uniref:DUF4381 domain-containing protein n=1 Tax=Imhoffiella purpurea TaxID=1249627 RepID=W9VH45_9GAMM|nr:DUF4381 domain-containing protein [Imhoffiella purpurea]EXJ15352.1 hypothetical protein D779_1448 [Imhoffiella purpurea]